ncbi:hypothetical protein QA584_08655 [Anaerocolumna sp. AGMB13025]|uniref:hypothetical protein n=1 Tax=Anaerocolumna sp. AGMB13025 TaxID=3039116 RepID=UPI0024204C67|nr:hypothetical protein [Anaerocolumna sp. AGMB13025]WFR59141.1 hypothetical protein QA584_08655 [Anaerocolumna sp. AGMB13025]
MPRDKIGQIRQRSPVVEGDMRRIFSEIHTGEEQPESICNFVLPHSNGLRLFTVDMGEDFAEKNRHNGCSVRGAREQIMADLRDTLKEQGYRLYGNASFLNVDVLGTLQKIMEHNTDYYQSDFQYDVTKLQEAAADRNADRHFFWLSRGSGTWCFAEPDVYISNTSPHNTWNYYGAGNKSEHVKTFWIELKGMRDEKVMGDIVELDYQKHLDYLCTHSFEPSAVEIVFKNPNDVRTFSYQEYDQNFQSIAQRYGTVERVAFRVTDPYELSRAAIEAHGLFWDAAEPMDIDTYVKRLEHDRLHDYGYTADDLVLTGPLDAEKAIKNGLACYALYPDGSKELIPGREVYQERHYRGALFGMTAEERSILQYFKQDCIPLFTKEEMREICSLAVQAGMENDPARSRLLDKIIHKAECMLPQEEQGYAPEQENEYNREDLR